MNQNSQTEVLPDRKDEADSEINLLDMVAAIGEEKKLILGIPVLTGLLAVVVSLFLTPVYTAKTTLIVPSSGGGGAAAALASLGGLASLAGISQGGTTTETFVSMLESRSAKDQIIDRFELLARYKTDSREDVYKKLAKNVYIVVDKKSNLIVIEFDDQDPEFAAKVANGYYEVLLDLQRRVAVTEAQQRRAFFQQQFQSVKEDLADAEVKLKETQERTGLVELKSQAEATIEAVARLRAEIAQREVQLSAMRTFATPDNSDYRRVAAELNGLKVELRKLEKGGSGGDSGLVSAGNLPEQGLEYVRALRNVKYQEAIFEIMAKQFELAKVDEAKDGGDIQQLDVAVPPQRKSKPKRAFIVILSTLAGGFFAILFVLGRDAYRKAAKSPQNVERFKKVSNAWNFRR